MIKNVFRDLDRIQTCNLLSRNQMRYSVAPRGPFLFSVAKVQLIFELPNKKTIFYLRNFKINQNSPLK